VVSLAAAPALTAFKHSLSQVNRGLYYGGEVVVSWIIFTVLVTAILTIMPDAEIDWSNVWIGAALTSALLVAGRFVISLYLAHAGLSAYGAVGSIAVLLLWAYYSALILLLGAEFTQVWTRARGERVVPEAGAVRVGRKDRVSARQPSPI
jgi:membrane protein